MKAKIERIKDTIYSNKSSGENDTSIINRFIDTYRFTANELVYMVDCRNGDVLVLNNAIQHVFRSKAVGIGNMHDLYAQVHNDQLADFLNLTYGYCKLYLKSLSLLNAEYASENIIQSLYTSKKGEKILRKTYGLCQNKEGFITYTVGHVTNVSSLFSGNQLTYQFDGPDAQAIYGLVNDTLEFANLLTKQEHTILSLVGKGWNSKQIGEKLFISPHTVYKHRRNIMLKLEVNNSVKAYNKAVDMGLLANL